MVTQTALPDPEKVPVMDLWPDTGKILRLSKESTYGAARRGEIPTLRIGRRIVVPVAPLRRMLGLDAAAPERDSPEAA